MNCTICGERLRREHTPEVGCKPPASLKLVQTQCCGVEQRHFRGQTSLAAADRRHIKIWSCGLSLDRRNRVLSPQRLRLPRLRDGGRGYANCSYVISSRSP